MYDIIVLENLRFRSSTRKREAGYFKISTLENVFEKMHLRWQNSPDTYVWTVGQTGKKWINKPDTCEQGLSGAVQKYNVNSTLLGRK